MRDALGRDGGGGLRSRAGLRLALALGLATGLAPLPAGSGATPRAEAPSGSPALARSATPRESPARQGGPGRESELFLTGARIVDGTGAPAYPGEVLIADGMILAIGMPGSLDAGEAERIELDGLVLAPGFIDIHNHSTTAILESPEAASQVAQGVTTIAVGADGSSPWPIDAYLERIAAVGPALNVGAFVGHGTLRREVMGEDFARPATAAEIDRMAALVAEAMEAGAFGLSSGLEYDPGFYASTEELIALARVAGERGGLYMSHVRDEEEGLLEAVAEAVRIGREARIPVQISHIKAGNASVWGRAGDVLDLLADARREGVDAMADQYPYTAWQSGLRIVVPSRRFDDPEAVAAGIAAAGGADRLQIVGYEADPDIDGLRLDEVAERWSTTPVAAYQRILETGGSGVIGHTMSPEDVEVFLRSELVMTSSDGGIGSAHPRGAGAFARILGHFVRERELLSLERAVERGSSQPAGRLGLRGRGVIRPGAIADLVAFDPATVAARSSFEEPGALATGVEWTWVRGVPVWANGGVTGATPGRALTRRGS